MSNVNSIVPLPATWHSPQAARDRRRQPSGGQKDAKKKQQQSRAAEQRWDDGQPANRIDEYA